MQNTFGPTKCDFDLILTALLSQCIAITIYERTNIPVAGWIDHHPCASVTEKKHTDYKNM